MLSCAGVFQQTVDFDPSANIANLPALCGDSFFISDYALAGGTYSNTIVSTDYPTTQSKCFTTVNSAGEIYLAGEFRELVDFNPLAATAFTLNSPNTNDLFIAKYTAAGNLAWAKQLKGPLNEEMYGILLDHAGNVLIHGYFEGSMVFDPAIPTATLGQYPNSNFIAKFDAAGNFMWCGKLKNATIPIGNTLAVDQSDNIYLTGNVLGVCDFDMSAGSASITSTAGSPDAFIAKYTPAGAYVFAFAFGNTMHESGTSIAVTTAGDIFISGEFNSNTCDFDPGPATANVNTNGGMDVFLAKYNSSGNYQFAYAFGDVNYDNGSLLVADANDNLYLTGRFAGTIDFDPSSSVSTITTTASGLDIVVAKYSPGGALLWASSFGGPAGDAVTTVTVDAANNLLTGGFFSGPADFDPSPATVTFTSSNTQAMFLAKYNSAGQYVWAAPFEGPTIVNSVADDNSGGVVAAGSFINQTDFDPSAQTYTVLADGGTNAFLAKFNLGTQVVVKEHSVQGGLLVYPNPSDSKIYVEYVQPATYMVEIFDGKGARVQKSATALPGSLDISFLQAGIYFAKFTELRSGEAFTAKLIRY